MTGIATPPAWPSDCVRPPKDEADLAEFFERQGMVDWLAPGQLAATGIKAMLASIFGAYADKRESQAALHPLGSSGQPYQAYHAAADASGDFWFDFCADLGDGFDPTYAVAWLLSRPTLRVPGVEGALPRGRLLVLGGDQVYPTANKREYNNRFIGPYQAAFCWKAQDQPHLYAIPGNHDWYDGLTSFLRLFCQQRWIGGWRTQQQRSYFALRLPHDWWLWGTDIQLESDVDRPQIEFFLQVASRMEAESAGRTPRVILCTAEPNWVYCDAQERGSRQPPRKGCRLPVAPGQFSNLEYFYRETIAPKGARLEAIVSGDLHHYTHYRALDRPDPDAPRHLITSGGGGAYLYPTHHMPESLEIPWRTTGAVGAPQNPRRFEQGPVYPSVEKSRALGRWSWGSLPLRNWRFAGMLASIYLVYAWVVQSASKSGNHLFDWWCTSGPTSGTGCETPRSLMELLAQLAWYDFWNVGWAFWDVLRHSPSGVVFALVIVFGLWQYRLSGGPAPLWGVTGFVHGALHLALAFVLIGFFSKLNRGLLASWVDLPWVDSPWQVVAFTIEMFLGGGLLGGWLFGLYLTLSSRLTGGHTNDVFSSQRLDNFKNFLRLHIDAKGKLTIYPIGVPEVPHGGDWKYRGGDPTLAPGEAWFDPPNGTIAVELIGPKPIEIP